jgi:Na+/proline symporter
MADAYLFEKHTFTVWDWVAFAAVLLASSAVGLYFGFVSRRKPITSDDYLLAGRSMGVFPVALSLLGSFMSAITLLGTPAEIAVYGTQYWMISVAYCMVIPLANYIFIPVFYKLNLTSIFEVVILHGCLLV